MHTQSSTHKEQSTWRPLLPGTSRTERARQIDRDVLGSDYPHRGQPGHLHENRFREPAGRRVPQHVVDFPRLQRVHEGQGPPRRALHHQPHLRHLRRQPRHLFGLRAEHGLRHPPARHRRMDHQPGRGGGIHVRPQHLPGQPGGRRFLRADGQGDQSGRAAPGGADARPQRQHPRLQHHRRHHADAEPVQRAVLPRGPGDEPPDPRDVLPHGRPPHASLDALSGRRGNRAQPATLLRVSRAADEVRRVHEEGRAAARRPVRFLLPGPARLRRGGPTPRPAGLLGLLERPRACATTPTRTWRSGATPCSSRRASSSTASW